MIEWKERGEEEQRLLLRHLEDTERRTHDSAMAPKLGWFWRFVGRLYLAYLRWCHNRRR